MRVPEELAQGLCAKAEDKDPWLNPRADTTMPGRLGLDLGAVCDGCPVFDPCMEYAINVPWRWVGVVIAGSAFRLNGEPYSKSERVWRVRRTVM